MVNNSIIKFNRINFVVFSIIAKDIFHIFLCFSSKHQIQFHVKRGCNDFISATLKPLPSRIEVVA